MKGIKELRVSGFQSHEMSVIHLEPVGLNVIVGPTHSGKTAIVRALRWLLYNEPQGIDFIRKGNVSAQIVALTADGWMVARGRGANYNRYYVTRPDGEHEDIFEGFGSNVPPEIQEATGVFPSVIGDVELNLNLSTQLEAPFLGLSSSTGPMRAKILGKLAGTEVVDYATKLSAQKIRREKEQLRADERRLEEVVGLYDATMKRYKHVDRAHQKLEQLYNTVQANTLKINELKLLRDRCQAATEKVQQAGEKAARLEMLLSVLGATYTKETAQALSRLEQLSGLRAKLDQSQRTVEKATAAIQRLERVEDAIAKHDNAEGDLYVLNQWMQWGDRLSGALARVEAARRRLQRIEHIDTDALFEKVRQADESLRRIDRLSELYYSFDSLQLEANHHQEALRKADETIEQHREEFRSLLTEAAICPTCGGQVEPAKIREVLQRVG